MAEVETGTASDAESIPKKSSKRALVIVAIVLAVVVALGAGGVYAYNQHQAEVVAEANAAAETVYNGFKAQYDKIVAGAGQGEASHDATLAALVSLNDLKATVEADSTTMYDGTHEGRDNVLKNINSSIGALKERISKEYDDTLTANTIDVNAEGVTKDALTAANEALATLKTLMSTDKETVEILDSESYDALIKNIDDLSAAYVAKAAEIQAAEEAAAKAAEEAAAKAAEEAAAAEAAAQAQVNNGGGYYDAGSYNNGGGYSGGTYSGGGNGGGSIYAPNHDDLINNGYVYSDNYGGIYYKDLGSIEDGWNEYIKTHPEAAQ